MTDPDPFELFKQTLKQFDASETTFDPGAFALYGWPMTPFPVAGSSEQGSNSTPAVGTKNAVTQLYAAIEALDSIPFQDGSVSSDWSDVLAGMTHDQFVPDSPERVGSLLRSTYQIWFCSFSQLLVESYTVRILSDELVVADHRNEFQTYKWLLELSQADREQLLLRCTEIDDELVGEMEAARGTRNELLYSFAGWDELTLENALEDATRYLHVLQQLDSRVVSGPGYSYLPDDE